MGVCIRMGNEMGTLPLDGIAFDAEEIKRLGKRFKKLDLDGSGSLSIEEFMQGLSHFSAKGDKESKLKFAFRIYDIDNDGLISNGELYQVMKMISGTNLKDTQLQQVVDKSIVLFDKDGKGGLNFSEFCEVIGSKDVQNKMGKYKSGITV